MQHHQTSRPASSASGPAPRTGSDAAPAAGSSGRYVRARDLPRLLPMWPEELAVRTSADHLRLLAKLRRALRVERQRGLAGHWAYNLARHAHLLRAYRCETAQYLADARHARQQSSRRRDLPTCCK